MLNQIAQLLGVDYYGETPATEREIEAAIEKLIADCDRWKGRAEKAEAQLAAHAAYIAELRRALLEARPYVPKQIVEPYAVSEGHGCASDRVTPNVVYRIVESALSLVQSGGVGVRHG